MSSREESNTIRRERRDDDRGGVWFGLVLVLIGLAFFLRNFIPWFSFNYVWPVLIVIVGIYLIFRRD